MNLIATLKKERRTIEKKITALQKELGNLEKASKYLGGVERKVRKRSAAARKRMQIAARKRWAKVKKGAKVATS